MKRIASLLGILIVLLALGSSALYADGPGPRVTPLPPKEGTVTGYVEHTVTVTIGEDGTRVDEGERGHLEHMVSQLVASPSLDQTVTWTCRSTLQYYDHGDWEEVQGMSDNWTDTTIYMLSVLGELYRNGNRLWNNTVTNYNATYVSSGYSPWYVGYNAFWQSKGTHWMKVTPGSATEQEYTEVSRQF